MKELDLILPLDQGTVETDNKFLGGRIVIGPYKTTPIEGVKPDYCLIWVILNMLILVSK